MKCPIRQRASSSFQGRTFSGYLQTPDTKKTTSNSKNSICCAHFLLASIAPPPSYEETTSESNTRSIASAEEDCSGLQSRRPSGAHPRVAVLLGVKAHWNIPLLICRALSTVPVRAFSKISPHSLPISPILELEKIKANIWLNISPRIEWLTSES